MFLLKKILLYFIEPMAIISILFMVGLCYSWFTKKKIFGRLVITVVFILIFLIGFTGITDALLRNLETKYPKDGYKDRVFDFIVVLGGNDLELLDRLVYGIELFKKYPNCKLVVSSTLRKRFQTVLAFGVPNDSMIRISDAFSTTEEANRISEVIEDKPFLLITSAYHMRRAMMVFRHKDLNPIPAPVSYPRPWINKLAFLQSTNNFSNASVLIHEYLGIFILKLIYFFK